MEQKSFNLWRLRPLFLVFLISFFLLYLTHTLAAYEAESDIVTTSASPSSITGTMVFTDVTAVAGISATHSVPDQVYYGIGQAWGDYNNDGWLDLYLTDNGGPNTLYLNNGDGTFSVSPLSASVALTDRLSAGTAFVDYDNDGWQDLYVLNLGSNTLYHNDGGIQFTDVTTSTGVGDTGRGETGSWGDYDQDGHLDLYVANWGCPACPQGSRDTLYHNNGDGTFTDVSAALDFNSLIGFGFVATWADYDNDQDLDLYVVYDKLFGNVLWRNDGPGCFYWCFTNVSEETGTNIEVDGMGLATGDYDNDGDLDFYFSHTQPAVLLQNQTSQGNPVFIDATVDSGLYFDAVSWGSIFFDYDNDGWLDAYLATMNNVPALSNRLFHNLGDGTFADVSDKSGANNAGVTLGVAYGDYDRDGWLDIVIGNREEGYYLYHNQGLSGAGNHWLSVKFVGNAPINRDGIGSRVYLHMSNGTTLMQEVKNGSSLGAGNQLPLHFGLGVNTVDQAVVVWPNGVGTIFDSTPVDQQWVVTYTTNPNQAPVAQPDIYSIEEDGYLTIAAPGVLQNDTDGDNNVLHAVLVDEPQYGTVGLQASGAFTYAPNANFAGVDSFTYLATDVLSNSNVVTVSLVITAVNDAPLALPDTYSTTHETPLVITAPGVLTNDHDIETAVLSATLVTSPITGSLALEPDGSFVYTPTIGFGGDITFTYAAHDGELADMAVVTITVVGPEIQPLFPLYLPLIMQEEAALKP